MKIQRELLYIIARTVRIPEKVGAELLDKHVRPDRLEWQRFLEIVFLTMGVGFLVIGIVFFFAYNWEDLHKFLKFGIAELLVAGATAAALIVRSKVWVRNVILAGASLLVGVLFAVFGQVYQTGANAYDFFLIWTIFIFLWTIVSGSSLQWLIFLSLLQVTYFLYLEQVAHDWDGMQICTHYLLFNTVAIAAFKFAKRYFSEWHFSGYLEVILSLVAFLPSTVAIMGGLHGKAEESFIVLMLCALLCYGLAFYYGFMAKKLYYLALIPAGGTGILASWFFTFSDDAYMFLTVSLFVIAAVTGIIFFLIHINKKWEHEEGK